MNHTPTTTFAALMATARRQAKMSQASVAQAFTDRGAPISPQSISAWEKERAYPNAEQFLMLCDILRIDSIRDTFQRTEVPTIFHDLNEEGRQKLYEHADLLRRSGLYTAAAPAASPAASATASVAQDDFVPQPVAFSAHATTHLSDSRRRSIKLYHLAVSAGTGQFLDGDSYDEIEVGNEVPASADFGITISGDSMEPQYVNGQTVWVHAQSTLHDGEIGIFLYDDNAYIKKLGMANGRTMLISLNRNYAPIPVESFHTFKVFGKVVG